MSIEKLWLSSPPWQWWCSTAVTMTDMHSIASTGQSCSLITVRYIYCCCQSHHSFRWLIVFVYWCCFKSSSCCGCYCLLQSVDWLVDCWSTSVFLLSPLLLCHCHGHLLCSKCSCRQRAIEDGQCNVCWQHHHRRQRHQQHRHRHHRSSSNVFSLDTCDFPYFTLHVQSVALIIFNPNFTIQDNGLSVNSP